VRRWSRWGSGIWTWLAWYAAVGQPAGADLLIDAAATHAAAGVQRALDAGVRADAEDGMALMMAACGGDVVTVKLLLAHGANASAERLKDYTPLMSASMGGNPEVIQLLIDAGADPNQATGGCHTPLELAAACGHESAVEVLLSRAPALRAMSAKGWLTTRRWFPRPGADRRRPVCCDASSRPAPTSTRPMTRERPR
jgi:ankyrin repeat protein